MADSPRKPHLIIDGPANAAATFVFAHGAGAGMESDFMAAFATELAKSGLRVVRFEFPYMAERRKTGKRRPPDREPVLRETWRQVLRSLEARTLLIGGKSMGGRIASLIADEVQPAGLVCLGYPFHPTGKPQRLRTAHLETIQTPTLILQGQRDTLGNFDEVGTYSLSKHVAVHWLPDGDHSFKPRKKSGRTQQENWDKGVQAVVEFARERLAL